MALQPAFGRTLDRCRYHQSASLRCDHRSTTRILKRLTTPVPTRFSDEELALIDDLVEQGIGDSRSAVIRQAIHQLAELVRRARVGADVTSTIRAIPTCIPVGVDEGIDHDSVATFYNVAAVPKSVLTTRLGQLGVGGRQQICSALDAMANC